MQGTAEDIPHPNDLYGFTTLIAHLAMLDYSMLAWINCMLVLNEDMAKERVRV